MPESNKYWSKPKQDNHAKAGRMLFDLRKKVQFQIEEALEEQQPSDR